MKTVKDYNFKGKKVLIRVDFNVPLDENQHITDDTRIRAALPTIQKIINDGGSVILMSHLGRPKGKVNAEMSLAPIAKHLQKLIGKNVKFCKECVGNEALEAAKQLQDKDILLLENLRFHNEEEAGDENFAEKLANLGDAYVNDAFGTAHRAHASTTIMAKFFGENKFFGLLMAEEVKNIEKILSEYEKPFTAIVGGAKVSDKVGIIENLLNRADHILIGGAMAYTFLKAKGANVGKSRVEEEKVSLAKELLEKAQQKGVKIHLPEDSIITAEFKEDAEFKTAESANIPDGFMGLDIGSRAQKHYREIILQSKTILWNGPMGVFEWQNFANGTKSVAEAVSEATSRGAYSLVGGGDSVAAVQQMGIADQVSYISTGGGAMLEALEGITLPGVKAILQ